MNLSQLFLPEFDQEMANTRRVLERIPNEKLEWRIHPKSNPMGWVASHLADLPGWAAMVLEEDSLDVDPPGGKPYRTPPAVSREEVLERFDRNVALGRAALAVATNEQFGKPWSLLMGGEPIFTLPRVAVLRGFVLSHAIHHRGHLCVYLRVNEIPVPALYGPSGDEAM